jgi:hypothetical protein
LGPDSFANVDVQPSNLETELEQPAIVDEVERSEQAAPEEVVAQSDRAVMRNMVVARSYREVCDTVKVAANSNGLPVPFFIHLLFQESRFDPGVISGAGAQGIAQFMPETAAAVGLDNPFDAIQAIRASARLLHNLARQFGNLGLAAAAYNAGPRRIEVWLAKKGGLPEETRNYVKTITGRPAEKWMTLAAPTPAATLPPNAPCREVMKLAALRVREFSPRGRPDLSHGVAMIATRARSRGTRAATKTSRITTDSASKPTTAQSAKLKNESTAIISAGRKQQRKFQLSQRSTQSS